MRMEITVDKTGRFINVVKVIYLITIYNLHIYDYFFIALTISPALMALACSSIFC